MRASIRTDEEPRGLVRRFWDCWSAAVRRRRASRNRKPTRPSPSKRSSRRSTRFASTPNPTNGRSPTRSRKTPDGSFRPSSRGIGPIYWSKPRPTISISTAHLTTTPLDGQQQPALLERNRYSVGHVAPRCTGQGPAQDAGVDRLSSPLGAHEHDRFQSSRRSAPRRAVARLSGSAVAHAGLSILHGRAVERSESVSRIEVAGGRTTARREHADQSRGRRLLPRRRAAPGSAAGAAHAIAVLDQHGVRPVGRRLALVAGAAQQQAHARLAALGKVVSSRGNQ